MAELTAVTLLLGVVLGWLAGGAPGNLKAVRIHGEGILLLLLPLTICLHVAGDAHPEASGFLRLVISMVAVTAALANVYSFPGLGLAAVGIFLNSVVVFRFGHMPVAQDAVAAICQLPIGETADYYHRLLSSVDYAAHVVCDVLPLTAFGFGVVLSLGDLLIGIGIAAFIVAAMTQCRGKSSGGHVRTPEGSCQAPLGGDLRDHHRASKVE